MIIIAHIAAALSGIALSTFLYFRPNDGLFKFAYFSVAATFVSGIALVVMTRASLLRACFTGIVYLLAVTFMLYLANKRSVTKQRS